jgi:hypothetical protein
MLLHPNVECCTPKSDFCAECIEEGRDEFNFGRCYFCRDFHQHEDCVGAPCQCPCPTPDQTELDRVRDAAIAKLTMAERRVLGV